MYGQVVLTHQVVCRVEADIAGRALYASESISIVAQLQERDSPATLTQRFTTRFQLSSKGSAHPRLVTTVFLALTPAVTVLALVAGDVLHRLADDRWVRPRLMVVAPLSSHRRSRRIGKKLRRRFFHRPTQEQIGAPWPAMVSERPSAA